MDTTEDGVKRMRTRDGFSLLEVVVAITILTAGLLAVAGATTYYFTQVRVTGVRSERIAAVQQAMEKLNATAFENLSSRSMSQADTVGRYLLWWDMTAPARDLRQFRVYSAGPGYQVGQGWRMSVRDTMQLSISRGRPR